MSSATMTTNIVSRNGNCMNVNAYAANAAMRIGMNVAGQRDAEAVDECRAEPCVDDRVVVVAQGEAAPVGGLSACPPDL
jgi:hypothetical protein